ncbi:MAG: outer membrane lipid asymmetry maintenance protein MlaD [Aestuariivirga sp.]
MKSNSLETLVGAAVIALAVAFFAFAWKTAGHGGAGGGYHVTADFDNASGVSVGSDVRIAGIKVGSVIGQTLNQANFQARIDMLINREVQISDDSSAKIASEGLLGSNFISLEPGGSETKLADGDAISYTQGAVDVWSLISQAMFSKPKGDAAKADAPKADAPAPDAPAADAPAPAAPDAAATDPSKAEAKPVDSTKTDAQPPAATEPPKK